MPKIKPIAALFDLAIRALGRAACLIFDLFWLSLPRKKKASDPRQVCVVRLDAIGDFVLWLPAAAMLRELYPRPDFELTAVVSSPTAELAEKCGLFDRVSPVDAVRLRSRMRYRLDCLRQMYQPAFGVVIHPTYSRTYDADLLVHATFAPKRVGSAGDLSNIGALAKRRTDRWYTAILPARDEPMNELDRNLEFVCGLGAPTTPITLGRIGTESSLKAGELSHEESGDFFVIFPGTMQAIKAWPEDRFAAIAKQISAETGWRIVICGGHGDSARCDRVQKLLEGIDCKNLCGQTTIPELAGLLSRARLLISNDTSAVHIAAAVGTPGVCVLGGGQFGRFLPYPDKTQATSLPLPVFFPMDCYGCNWRCIYKIERDGAAPCILNVTVDQMLDKAHAAIEASRHREPRKSDG